MYSTGVATSVASSWFQLFEYGTNTLLDRKLGKYSQGPQIIFPQYWYASGKPLLKKTITGLIEIKTKKKKYF